LKKLFISILIVFELIALISAYALPAFAATRNDDTYVTNNYYSSSTYVTGQTVAPEPQTIIQYIIVEREVVKEEEKTQDSQQTIEPVVLQENVVEKVKNNNKNTDNPVVVEQLIEPVSQNDTDNNNLTAQVIDTEEMNKVIEEAVPVEIQSTVNATKLYINAAVIAVLASALTTVVVNLIFKSKRR